MKGGVNLKSSIFNRWELKYVIHIKDMHTIINDIKPFVVNDESGNNGKYKIKSLYFDSPNFLFYKEKIDGEKYRQKVRIRGYNQIGSEDNVYVEIKQRYNQTVQKRRVGLPLTEAYKLLIPNKSYNYDGHEYRPVIEEILYLKYLYNLEPKVIISYDRLALMSKYEDNIRITFDTNLKCRSYDLSLENRSNETYFIPPQYSVLEIKVNDKIPIWLTNILRKHNITANRTSKYCLAIDRLNNI